MTGEDNPTIEPHPGIALSRAHWLKRVKRMQVSPFELLCCHILCRTTTDRSFISLVPSDVCIFYSGSDTSPTKIVAQHNERLWEFMGQ